MFTADIRISTKYPCLHSQSV